MLLEALKEHDNELLVGWLPHREEIRLKERYLGLQTAEERSWTEDQIELLASLVEQNVPLNELLAASTIELPVRSGLPAAPRADGPVRIGIARDRAFCFYYEAGIDELRRRGAELVEFSTLTSSQLPGNLDALYFGGGYPELYAETLSNNRNLLSDLREFAAAGKLVYGECGGLILLSRELITLDGNRWPMAGLLPLCIAMTDRLVHFGYADVHFEEDSVAAKHTWLRGHSSAEPGHAALLRSIGQESLLNLNMRLGEGTGTALAMNIIGAAVAAFVEMATFESAGVSDKHTLAKETAS